jgi:hypothetical protein
MNRKGQSALEFLMTYGWAILVVLAAIGALAYFGVLNPSNFLPDQCTASTGFGCVGKPVIDTTGNILFVMTNGQGGGVTLVNTAASIVSSNTSCANTNIFFCARGSTYAACSGASLAVTDGQEFQMAIKCGTAGNIHKATVTINYTSPMSGLGDQMLVQIAGKKRV